MNARIPSVTYFLSFIYTTYRCRRIALKIGVCLGSDNYLYWIALTSLNHPRAHDDVIRWKHFPRYWPFVRSIHPSPVNFPHKGQWRGALMFFLIHTWINDWVNNREAGELRRYHAHYVVIVMLCTSIVDKTHEIHFPLAIPVFKLYYE